MLAIARHFELAQKTKYNQWPFYALEFEMGRGDL